MFIHLARPNAVWPQLKTGRYVRPIETGDDRPRGDRS
jgi:hypothetical protein